MLGGRENVLALQDAPGTGGTEHAQLPLQQGRARCLGGGDLDVLDTHAVAPIARN